METYVWNKNYKFCLIGKINGMAAEAKRTRARILKHPKKEEQLWALDSRKRLVGEDIRHHLLAYAFMRGVPYSKLERSCRKDNKPYAAKILKIVLLHYPFDAIATLPKVEAWLAEGL